MGHNVRWLAWVLIVVALAMGGRIGGAATIPSSLLSGLYVPNSNSGGVAVYAPDAAGDMTPLRLIDGALTELYTPVGVALDGTGSL